MTKKQLQKEWERNKHEIHYQKPRIDGPYPKEVVSLRNWLMIAQVLLGKIGTKPHDGWILEMAYKKLMIMYKQDKQRLAVYF